MVLQSLFLQNFRNYQKSEFNFSPHTTLIIGPNASGKSNLIEAICVLSTGKSFRTEKDADMIQFGQEISRVACEMDETKLEVVFTNNSHRQTPYKKYVVNGIGKRRVDFEGILPSVLFSPLDLEIVIGSPGNRRGYLDEVLEQTDREYRVALMDYVKALRQRNALLDKAQKTGQRLEKEFEYWDQIIIDKGQLIAKKRESYIHFINAQDHDVFPFSSLYDRSEISKERLFQYKDAELGAGVTLVGPHRDDAQFFMKNIHSGEKEVKVFGSRGQQRLLILQLKLLQITYIEKHVEKKPLLLLDDIFSELDAKHVTLALSLISKQQTIITTTHKELITEKFLKEADMVELK